MAAGPRGFCVDPGTVERRSDGGFAVLASCNILSRGMAGPEISPALITVSVGPSAAAPARPDGDMLAELSEAPLLADRSRGAFTLVQLGAGGDRIFPGSAERYWRGAFLVGLGATGGFGRVAQARHRPQRQRAVEPAARSLRTAGIFGRDERKQITVMFAMLRLAYGSGTRPASGSA